MPAIIPTMNGCMTFAETGFNLMGYLPRHQFPRLHSWSVTWRNHCGKGQLITGLALIALGFLAHYTCPFLAKESCISLPLKTVSLGLLYANHGVFNILRSFIENRDLPGITLVYDFYGRKVLPALNPAFDFMSPLFAKIKELLDRLIFITLFPPQIVAS